MLVGREGRKKKEGVRVFFISTLDLLSLNLLSLDLVPLFVLEEPLFLSVSVAKAQLQPALLTQLGTHT